MADTMTAAPAQWGDLRSRVISGCAMVVVGILGIWLGGIWFKMLAVFVTAVMIWELARMIRVEGPSAMLLAALTASILSGLLEAGSGPYLVLLLLPAAIGAAAMPRDRPTFFFYALGIGIAGWGLVTFRAEFGMLWLFWLVIVVVVTDVAGYFAGRLIGGPKFWPAISPKKTWAGTIAGWIGAGAVGLAFSVLTKAGPELIWLSPLLAFASQMGDIAESALKRRMGVKDSSTLIPGHGGLFDRFDGLLGASLFLLALALVMKVPEVTY